MKAELAQRDDKALYNLRKFYGNPNISEESLDECVYRHKTEIGKAIENKDEKLERVYRLHLQAVKETLLARRCGR